MAVSSASSNDLDSFAISVSWLVVSHGNLGDFLLLPIMLGLHPNWSSMNSTMQDVVLGYLKVELLDVSKSKSLREFPYCINMLSQLQN